jgi:hypothetical protein
MYDHVGGIFPDIDAPMIRMNARSVRHVKEAGKGTLVADQEGLEMTRPIILDCAQTNPVGKGIPTAHKHGHELL